MATLAKERTLERIKADGTLIGPYRGEVEKVIADNAIFLTGMRELLAGSSVKGWQASFDALDL